MLTPQNIKRNDPCYCGSGKKYKNCHLPIDRQAEQEERRWEEAARFLRRDLLNFARDERFAGAVDQALPLYWNGLYQAETAEEMSVPEALRFFDWFAFDYSQEVDGAPARLIEVYRAEKWEALSSQQQTVLAQWLEAMPASVFELLGYDGDTMELRDIISGQQIKVFEPAGRSVTKVGDYLLGRPVPVHDRLEFSTNAAYLPKAEIADLPQKLQEARATDAQEHPQASLADFLRRNGHIAIYHALEQAEKQGRPPVARLDPHHQRQGPRRGPGQKRFQSDLVARQQAERENKLRRTAITRRRAVDS